MHVSFQRAILQLFCKILSYYELGHFSKRSPQLLSCYSLINLQKIISLESELQRAHDELKLSKQQLAVSETTKAEALRELAETKSLLDQISHIEHFAASDNALIQTTSLPSNWGDGSDWQSHLDAALGQHLGNGLMTAHTAPGTANHSQDIGTLHNELEMSKSNLGILTSGSN